MAITPRQAQACPPRERGPTHQRPALSLVEVVLAMLIVSVTLVSAMALVPSMQRGSAELADRALAEGLAADLAAEIASTPFESSLGAPVSNANRLGFVAVDHYHGWSAAPPVTREGNHIDGAARLSRRVSVEAVELDTLEPATITSEDSGVRIVTVHVAQDGIELASHVIIRTRAGWEAR